jgi:hypothetical protein
MVFALWVPVKYFRMTMSEVEVKKLSLILMVMSGQFGMPNIVILFFVLSRGGGVRVLSHERFLGYPFAGGQDAKSIAERLHGLMPNAKILIVIREQRDLMRSLYVQYLRRVGSQSLHDLVSRKLEWRLPQFSKSYLEFDRPLDWYAQRFGKNNLLVLPYELLRFNQTLFVNDIMDFCGLETRWEQAKQRENDTQALTANLLLRKFSSLFISDSLNGFSYPLINLGNTRMESFKRGISYFIPKKLDRFWIRRMEREIEQIFPSNTFFKTNANAQRYTHYDLKTYNYDWLCRS